MSYLFRRGALLAVTAIFSLPLVSCAAAQGSQSGGIVAARGGKVAEVSLVKEISAPGGITVDGLRGERVLSSTGATARWMTLPGATDFNQTISNAILAKLQAHAESRASTYTPQVFGVESGLNDRGCVSGSLTQSATELLADPNLVTVGGDGSFLTVACEPTLAAGKHFGLRLRAVTGTPESVTGDTAQTFYANVESGESSTGAGLFSEEGLVQLYDRASQLGAKPMGASEDALPTVNDESLEALRTATSDVTFETDGTAYVTIAPTFQELLAAQMITEETPNDTEPSETENTETRYTPAPLFLKIPAEQAPHYFGGLGQGIVASLIAGEIWAGNPPVSPGQTFVDCDLNPCLALTFDDDPSEYTPRLLDDLANQDAAATFFVIGQYAANLPEIVQQTAAAGHEIGNHTWAHPDLTTLNAEQAAWQVSETTATVASITGVPTPFVRPPYGAWNEPTLGAAQLPFIMWSIDTNDWQKPPAEELISRVVNAAVPGDIVLMHDIHESTVLAVPEMLGPLKARGFSLVTISQLFETTPTEMDIFISAKKEG